MLRLLNGSQTCGGPLIRTQGVIRRPRLLLLQAQSLQSPAGDHRTCALRGLQRRWETSQRAVASRDGLDPASETATDASRARPSIREYLAQWEKENLRNSPQTIPHDSMIVGAVSNDLTRTQSTGSSEMDHLSPTRGGMTDDPEGEESQGGSKEDREADEVLVLGAGQRNAGDLVELRAAGSRVPIFAVYLGFFGERNHFYAANGRWITSRGFSSLFTVSRFASKNELAPVMAKIPLKASPEEFDELRQADRGPSRADAAVLLERMSIFGLKAQRVYQANIERLDAARRELSREDQTHHMSLAEVAEQLLPESCRRNGDFPAYALYAVHTAIARSEIGFRPLNPSSDCHRPDNLIEIFSKRAMEDVESVAAMLREYSSQSMSRLGHRKSAELEDDQLGLFLHRARKAVLASRTRREWTPHGILKPAHRSFMRSNTWSKEAGNERIIRFLEWWASHDIFEPGSRFHNYGALILRALKVYDESVTLDQSTAWTFLQEIGVIQPWELPSRFKARLPGVTVEKGRGLSRPAPDVENCQRTDIALDCRTPHDEATIFCIDAPSTIIVDDGVSLERTQKPDEFWIHIHAADPASGIEPNSGLREYMSQVPQNIYLPGHFQAMLPENLGDARDFESEALIKQFSLKSGSLALTFSAKVNEDGDVLDLKVEPTRLGKVVYIDPKEVAEFCGEPAPLPVPTRTLQAGKPPKGEAPVPNRKMVAARDLDRSSKEDLRVMYRLAEAVHQKRLQKGAWPYFFPGPSVSVLFHESSRTHDDSVVHVPPDPYIKVGYESSTACSIVSNFMVLAGAIAAQWCASRGIPIPYRRDIRLAENADKAYDYATREIYPLIAKGAEPSFSQRQELSQLTGGIELSSQPGPYFLLGLDMYAKATSPLRRFSDLLVHWQIHAALKHERGTGRPIDARVDDLGAILPFSGPRFDDMLAHLQLREKIARTMARGVTDWILIALVRAWRFENSAPRSIRFTVTSHLRQALLGRLDLFNLTAVMDVERLGGLALVKDIRVGDQFEVELADVNAHSRQILVKALRYLGAPASKTTPSTSESAAREAAASASASAIR